MVEVAIVGGVTPYGGAGLGVRYMERGSLLAQMLFNAGSSAGAGARAQQTGQDQYYTVDVSPKSSAGLALVTYGGGGKRLTIFDLFYGIPVGSDELPVVIDVGCAFEAASTGKKDGGGLGLVLGAVFPVTRFAQLEGHVRGMLGQDPTKDDAKSGFVWTADIDAVGNIGNRYFVRAQANIAWGVGANLSGGFRL
jgi:hypothetical protein